MGGGEGGHLVGGSNILESKRPILESGSSILGNVGPILESESNILGNVGMSANYYLISK